MATESEEYKELSCRDFRSDCDFTIRAETEEELLGKCQEHACGIHGICLTSPRIKAKIKSRIKNIRVSGRVLDVVGPAETGGRQDGTPDV